MATLMAVPGLLRALGANPAGVFAERLGYAAPSAFTHASNRWAGTSPARWRALRQQPSTDGELSRDLPAPTDD